MHGSKPACFILLPLLTAALLSGCDRPARTTQWYSTHTSEMLQVWATCQDTGDNSQDCQNATREHDLEEQLNAPLPDMDTPITSEQFRKEFSNISHGIN